MTPEAASLRLSSPYSPTSSLFMLSPVLVMSSIRIGSS